MDRELYDPTIKTPGDDVRGPIENPGHLIETEDGGTSVILDRSIMIIGCDEAADVRINGDDVAPYHAEIILIDGSYRIRHLDGKAPVKLNGATIKKATLKDGDSITVSKRAFVFRAPAS